MTISARNRHRAQDGVEDAVGRRPLQLRLRAELKRCRHVGFAMTLTSSGVTKSRALSHAQALAVASSAVTAARGDPELDRRAQFGWPARGRRRSRSISGRDPSRVATDCAARSGRRRRQPARMPAASRLRGSKPVRVPWSPLRSRPRAKRIGIVSLSRNRSSWASGSGYVPFVLDWVLGGGHQERVGERPRRAVDSSPDALPSPRAAPLGSSGVCG